MGYEDVAAGSSGTVELRGRHGQAGKGIHRLGAQRRAIEGESIEGQPIRWCERGRAGKTVYDREQGHA